MPLFLEKECADMSAVIDDWLHKCASDGLTECALSFETLELAHDPVSAKHKSELMQFVLRDYTNAGYTVNLPNMAEIKEQLLPEHRSFVSDFPLSFTISWDPSVAA
jgi:hypothetical protein